MATTAFAAPPVVQFDVAQTVGCRPAMPPECGSRKTFANVVEVVFDISTRLAVGKESDLKAISYQIVSPDWQLSVVGYLPMTTLASEVADGVINVEETQAAGQINLEYAGTAAKIQAPLSMPTATKVVTKKLAPKSLLLSSGTIDRAHGVQFRLHPSQHDSLERTHQFVCYFEVPENFRADYVQVICQATRRAADDETGDQSAGFAKFTVGIYRDDDRDAKAAVEEFADRLQDLRRATLAVRTAAAATSVEPTAKRDADNDMLKGIIHLVHKPNTKDPREEATKRAALARQQQLTAQQQFTVTKAQRAAELAMQQIRALKRNSLETSPSMKASKLSSHESTIAAKPPIGQKTSTISSD